VLAASFRDEQDAFNCTADTQFLRNQDESRTAAVANVFTEVVGQTADIVAYKYPSLSGGDSQDNVIGETVK
jgi:hypothetical protein